MHTHTPLTATASTIAPWQRNTLVFYAALFLIFALAVGVRWYCMAHKTYVHLDESTSVILSTVNAPGWERHFEDGITHTGKDMRRQAYAVSPGLGSLGRNLFTLRMDSRDPPHSNLYYTFYRVALTGLDTYDIQSLLWRGCVLNLAFFTLSFWMLFQLGRLIFAEDRSVILLALLLAVMNPAALSNSLFVRPYQMQETLFIGMALLTVWYVLRLRAGHPCPGYGLFFAHALTVGLCLLSGYFAFFYVPLLGTVLLRESITQKQQRYIPYFVTLTVLGALLAWALYASFMVSLFINRGVEASEKLSLQYLLSNAGYLIDKFTYLYGRHVLGIGGAIVLALGAWFSRGRLVQPLTRLALTMLLICVLWSFAVFTLAPYKNLRYFMPAVPLVLFFACSLFQYARHRHILMPACLLCTLPLVFVPGNLEYYQGQPPIAPQEKPYLASFTEPWRPGSFLPYIADSQTIVFYNDCQNLRDALPLYQNTFLLVDTEQFQHCRLGDIENLHKTEELTYFSIYSIGPATSETLRNKP